jgi:hypothetical protein
VANIPLSWWISLMPYAEVGKETAGKSKTDIVIKINGKTIVSSPGQYEDHKERPTSYSFGGDIVIRPFRNSPNWKISLGTMFQQIEANTSEGEGTENQLYMASLTYEWGKAYKDIYFGPVTR